MNCTLLNGEFYGVWINLNFIKIKSLTLWKKLLRRWKDKLQTEKKIFASHVSDKGLISGDSTVKKQTL